MCFQSHPGVSSSVPSVPLPTVSSLAGVVPRRPLPPVGRGRLARNARPLDVRQSTLRRTGVRPEIVAPQLGSLRLWKMAARIVVDDDVTLLSMSVLEVALHFRDGLWSVGQSAVSWPRCYTVSDGWRPPQSATLRLTSRCLATASTLSGVARRAQSFWMPNEAANSPYSPYFGNWRIKLQLWPTPNSGKI